MLATQPEVAPHPSPTNGTAKDQRAAKNAQTRLNVEQEVAAAKAALIIAEAKLARIEADEAARESQTEDEQRAALLRSEQNDWQRRKRMDITGHRDKARALEHTGYVLFKRTYQRCKREGMPVNGVEIAEERLAKWIGCTLQHVRRLIADLKPHGLRVFKRPRGRKGCHNRYVFLDYPIRVDETGEDVLTVADVIAQQHTEVQVA